MQGMVEDLRAAPEGAIVILHACAHNPTGACQPAGRGGAGSGPWPAGAGWALGAGRACGSG